MKKIIRTGGIALFLALGTTAVVHAQQATIEDNTPWIWMGGDTTVAQPGVYGTKGVPSTANKPGARSQAASWTDISGNFWLFGGRVYGPGVTEALRNDLWKYTPSTKEWTWVAGDSTVGGAAVTGTQGVPATTNIPSARSLANHWKDNAGNFWIFGGSIGLTTERGNDLWRFNPLTNEWTWMKGTPGAVVALGIYGTQGVPAAANQPGSRSSGATWVDTSNNLWLFGGQGIATATSTVTGLSDWWKYNIATNEWTWMGGPNVSSPAANYGTQGVAAATNRPGGRMYPVTWRDTSGKFWMMGGYGYVTSTQGLLNDLWKLDPATNQWTWVSGSSVLNSPGRYLSKGAGSADRMPRGRMISTSWTDLQGNLWLFGGITSSFQTNTINDIWKYNIAANEWTWVKGDSTIGIPPQYNTLGVPSAANEIGARGVQTSWREKNSNNVWVFGGHFFSGSFGTRNDLWKIEACAPLATLPAIVGLDTVCAGDTLVYTAPFISNVYNYFWTIPSGWTMTQSFNVISLVTGTTSGTISVRALGNCGDSSNVQVKNISIEPVVTPVITQAGAGNNITLSVTGNYTNYQWYFNGTQIVGATGASYQPTQNGAYIVMVTSAHGCVAMSQARTVSSITAIQDLKVLAGIKLYPNPAVKELNVSSRIPVLMRITDLQGKVLVTYTLKAGAHKTDIGGLADGIYLAEFRTLAAEAYIATARFVKQQ